jgi:glycosyltransferase involved in cell wall biosynthesis
VGSTVGSSDAYCRVLMLVSGFPPAQQFIARSVKFAQYLPEYGWIPVVVTTRLEAGHDSLDIFEAPDVHVERTRRIPTLGMLATSILRRMGADAGSTSSASSATSLIFRTMNAAVVRAARQVFLWGDTPDSFAGWIPFAVLAGRRLVIASHAAALYASGPPFSVVLAGGLLARLTGLPLVADFRDSWTLDASDPIGTMGGPFQARVTPTRVRVLRALERWSLRHSAAVLFTSRATRALYAREYPQIAARSHLIYNGADPGDFIGEVKAAESPTVAHAGTVHDFQWSQVSFFLRLFARALCRGSIPADTQVVFAGTIGAKLRDRLLATACELRIRKSLQVPGPISHPEAVALMRASDVLLLFAGENSYVRLSKISEYLAAGAAMLAFAAPDSETAEEVRRYGGCVVSRASEHEVESWLSSALSSSAARRRSPLRIDCPHPLNRRSEAGHLAGILDALADVKGGR